MLLRIVHMQAPVSVVGCHQQDTAAGGRVSEDGDKVAGTKSDDFVRVDDVVSSSALPTVWIGTQDGRYAG